MSWTTAADLRAKLRRRWDDQSLLRAYAAGEPFPVVDVPVRGPRPGEIGERLSEVRAWVAALEAGQADGARYRLSHTEVGGRLVGRNRLPARAHVESYPQAWALLGLSAEVARLDAVLRGTTGEPTVAAWVRRHPLRAIALHDDWPRLLAAYRWLEKQRGSGRYLREISAPGVDTKVAEQHRALLGELLGVPRTVEGFAAGLGLAAKPHLVRLRPCPSLGVLAAASELALRDDELTELPMTVRSALVLENETTYLSVPVPVGGVVLWGKGYDVDRVGALPWLRDVDVRYWGDLDTHGFAILDRLRAWLPQTESVLMDRATLLAHRERWGSEDRPTSARLGRLRPDEQEVYADLVEDRLGPRVRLEQERVDWEFARTRLRDHTPGDRPPGSQTGRQ